MIPSLRRFTAISTQIAGILLFALLWLPLVVSAQTTQMRAAPTKVHSAAHTQRYASPWVPNPAVNGKDSYLIVDATSGRELSADNADDLRHPASLTKLMTLYLTFSALDAGQLSLDDGLPVSMNALNAPPTKMGFTLGRPVVVRDAIMGLVTRSANDAAVLLGEALGGDEENFARMMTQKARQLGMSSTVYRNASGLPNREQVTTARDMARLANALLRDFPHYYPIFSVQSYSYRGRPLANHNRMLETYAGADGLKTGYTVASGFNLVMSAMRDNRRLIGVVMGGSSPSQRDKKMAELMDQGFATAQSLHLSAWTSPRIPASARYAAANFVPGAAFPEAPRLGQVVRAEPAAVPTVPPPAAALQVATASPTAPVGGAGGPAIGSWAMQVGSFADARSAEAALERASAILPDGVRRHSAVAVDEVQTAQKTLHRARLTNLSQSEALEGCKRLEQRKIYCSPLQITAWNTPGAH